MNVLREGSIHQLEGVAQVAMKCLKLSGEERPTMREVVQELSWIKGSTNHAWVQQNVKENESLLGNNPSLPSEGGVDSLQANVLQVLEIGC
ncbi:hypothetical protein AMTR_s00102p00052400 [Amborella trichopoda]|uniref:Serine-threonine/tyrosine-protein kinase catalytic domain-containing protein n=1 Tax=Amborella trichopoda TaxID=13333 RepID=W1NYR0_AMBTC|nr:hypothetical protein AMTR_s00102p00052400 [Amborella trichopoda]